MSAIASLAEDRVVEGVYAVAKKERRRTRGGSPYLALELVDPSGRIEARVWSDVELLDSRFGEGDAVRVLGRVERFRDRLQLEVRSLEAAEEADPAAFAPAMRRDAAELDGFLEFLAAEISHPGLRATVRAVRRGRGAASRAARPAGGRDAPRLRGRAARAHGRRGDALPRGGAAASAAASRPRARGGAAARRRPHAELERGPTFRATDEGRLLGHVHLGLRLVEERAAALETEVRAELLHAIAVHHDMRGARTAEASVLYHANQLDATAATRPVE